MNYIGIVDKYDDAIEKVNPRILEIKNGFIRYYSKVQGFKGDPPNDVPKAAISFESIIDMIEIPEQTKTKTISFTFPKSLMLTGKEILESTKKQAKPKDNILKWAFLFKNELIRNQVSEIFANNLSKVQKPHSTTVKAFILAHTQQQIDQLVGSSQFEDSQSNVKADKHQKHEQVQKLWSNMKIQEITRLQKEEEIKKQTKQQQEEEALRLQLLKEEEERKRKEEEAKLLKREQERQLKQKVRTAWEFRYFQALQDCLESQNNFDASMKNGLRVMKFMENFRDEAMNAVKHVIQELIEVQMTQGISDQRVFRHNNMIIQIATTECSQRTVAAPSQSKIISKATDHFNDWGYWETAIYTNSQKRVLSEEFEALSYVNDMCYALKLIDRGFRLKVPIACLIEYVGVKALVIAQPPSSLDETSLMYGLIRSDNYKTEKIGSKQEAEVQALGKYMSIKPHLFSQKDKKASVYLSIHTQIHQGRFDDFVQLKEMLKMYADEERETIEKKTHGVYYINNCRMLLPQLIDERYALLIEQVNAAKTDTDAFFVEPALQEYELRRANSAFIVDYYESGQMKEMKKTYNPDAYDTNDDSNETYQDQLQIADMSKYFFKGYFQQFSFKVDQLHIKLIDSYTLRNTFALFGINMKYLGLLAEQTQIPEIRSLCEREMMARSLKSIFNNQFWEYLCDLDQSEVPMQLMNYYQVGKAAQTDDEIQRSPRKKNSAQIEKVSQERMEILSFIEAQFKTHFIEILQMIFSSSKLFYEQVLFKQVYYDFNYDLKNLELCSGGFILAIQHNFKLEINYDPIYLDTPYSQPAVLKYGLRHLLKPKSQLISFHKSTAQTPLQTPQTPQSKKKPFEIVNLYNDVYSYQQNELELCKLIHKAKIFKQQKNYQVALKVLQIRLNMLVIEHSCQVNDVKSEIYTEIADVYYLLEQPYDAIANISAALGQHFQKTGEARLACVSFIQSITTAKINVQSRHLRPLMLLLEITIKHLREFTLDVLDLVLYHLQFMFGTQSHWYAEVLRLMSQYDEEEEMQSMMLICLIQNLGQSHLSTADAYIQIGEKKSPQEQLLYLEKAFFIYETLYNETNIEFGLLQVKLAKAYNTCGRLDETAKVSYNAIKILKANKNRTSEVLEMLNLRSMSLLKMGKNELVLKECEDYFSILIQQDDIPAHTQSQIQISFEIFLNDLETEHRNFLYQLSDSEQEILEPRQAIESVILQLKIFSGMQLYLESLLMAFLTDQHSFKHAQSDAFKDAQQRYLVLIAAVGKKQAHQIFEKVIMLSL